MVLLVPILTSVGSSEYLVTLITRFNMVTWSPGHRITWPGGHLMTWPPSHLATCSPCHLAT